VILAYLDARCGGMSHNEIVVVTMILKPSNRTKLFFIFPHFFVAGLSGSGLMSAGPVGTPLVREKQLWPVDRIFNPATASQIGR
jgi:hypothetical protein